MKKYKITSAFLLCFCSVFGQINFAGNQSNQMPPQRLNNDNNVESSNLSNKFVNVNENINPPVQEQQIQVIQQQIQNFPQTSDANQNIEPTLENGFHIRFQVASSLKESTTKSTTTSYHKSKKIISKKSFTRRNRIKNRLHKKRVSYNTSLCYNF